MTGDQFAVSGLLAATLALFAWGRWRYDVVAFLALIGGVLLGLIPAADAFAGFSHPAVITVVAVLILSRAIARSGVIDLAAGRIGAAAGPLWIQIGVFSALAAVLSAFMNNVGALALLMPVAIQSATKAGHSPAAVLMPLSFASMLGGMITLIGTPPNVIIATYRATIAPAPFGMFDFTPVGLGIAVVGLLFVSLIGWRLIPERARRRKGSDELFDIEDYVTEARVPEDAAIAGKTLRELAEIAGEQEVDIVGLIRDERRILGGTWWERVRPGDILILEAAPDALERTVAAMKLELAGDMPTMAEALRSEEIDLVEAVVMPRSLIEGLTSEEIRLRTRYGINLLAVARQGRPHRGRLKSFRFEAGDVLLLQGEEQHVAAALSALGCLPLARRGLQVGRRRRVALTLGIAVAALGAAAFGLLPVPIALSAAVLALLLARVMPVREAYESIDWSVVVLLGAMIPVGQALETTGTTRLIADGVLGLTAGTPAFLVLTLVLVVTMTLSDIVNNAATAVMMAPIAVGVAERLGVAADPFLMAVAVGASCAFLTPIGHQNNTLVMGPGGYRFWDYWRMGLPLEAAVVAAAVPLILLVWPL